MRYERSSEADGERADKAKLLRRSRAEASGPVKKLFVKPESTFKEGIAPKESLILSPEAEARQKKREYLEDEGTTEERAQLVRDVIRDRRATREEIIYALGLVPDLYLQATREEVELVRAARAAGISWDRLAEAQGLGSRQSALVRHQRLVKTIEPLPETD